MEQRGTKCYLVEEARGEETIRCGEMLIMRLQQPYLHPGPSRGREIKNTLKD